MRWIHWFRNDLRLADNPALADGASRATRWLGLFVLDERLLGSDRMGPPRLRFLADCLERIAREIEARGGRLVLRSGDPRAEVPRLAREVRADGVSWNRDTTPYARRRDREVERRLARAGCRTLVRKDRVVFEAPEVRTRSGSAFSVYTPYRRAWWSRLREEGLPPVARLRLPAGGLRAPSGSWSRVRALGARGAACAIPTGGERAAARRLRAFLESGLRDYAQQRDRPDRDGTSRLSAHLRFGTISVRECVRAALDCATDDPRCEEGATRWIDELVWRDFYAALVQEHPRVLVSAHRPVFEHLDWEDDPEGLAAWEEGRTGFPFVDAGLRQLRATGWMHNRARMVAASFLTKDLGIDWREGERHFLSWLVDGDPASNNGGWQWCASTGTDAQPWFRIFNPLSQSHRFDPHGRYIRRWVPELRGLEAPEVHEPPASRRRARGYPPPRVDHREARARALARYRAAQARAGS